MVDNNNNSILRPRGDSLDETNLVVLLRAGGAQRQGAVGQLFRRYASEFVRYFRRHGLTPEAAEDLMQDTFVQIVRALDDYRGEGSLAAWLWIVARNNLMSRLRERKQVVSLEAMQSEETGSPAFDVAGGSNPAAADCLKRTFASFAAAHPEYAETLVRLVVDGWNVEQLAQFRQSNPGAAREYLSQCRKRLFEFVQPCFELAESR